MYSSFDSSIRLLFSRLAYTRVKLEDIANGTYKNASHLTYHAHSEWTRKGSPYRSIERET